MTIIAFVGSVFSSYYHWAGRGNPEDHVAINVALYRPNGNLWAMTERGSASLSRSAEVFSVGPSSLRWEGGRLIIDFDELSLPFPPKRLLPKRVRGRVTLTPSFTTSAAYALDEAGRHQWWPVAPASRIRVEGPMLPDGGWEGHGYHDMNWGDRPLEADFADWDWSRGENDAGEAIIVYDARMRDASHRKRALRFAADGTAFGFEAPASQPLSRGLWGVRRAVACDAGKQPSIVRTLEDTPFYMRSIVDTAINGEAVHMMHETLDCRRLHNRIVRLMLPFRMPRRR